MEPLVSIIIPVYNVEEYLSDCLDSIARQSYATFEAILIDDGSTDQSARICDNIAQKDSRFIAFHKKNEGVSASRNAGLKLAKGDFVTFIDSDDYVTEDYLYSLVHAISSLNTNIAIVGGETVYCDAMHSIAQKHPSFRSISTSEYLHDLLLLKVPHSIWGKMFRRCILSDIEFSTAIYYAEDFDYLVRAVLNEDRIAISDENLYFYLFREKSAMHSNFNKRQLTEIMGVENGTALIEKIYPSLISETKERRLYSYFLIIRWILYSEDSDQFLHEKQLLEDKITGELRDIHSTKAFTKTMRMKIFLFRLGGTKLYFVFQKLIDRIRQLRTGHNFL